MLNRIGKEILVFDGAMGTELQARGLPPGGCPELMNIEAPDIVRAIHSEYVEAGAQIIETNTFGALPIRLEHYGLGHRVTDINVAAVKLAREAAGGRALVAAAVGPLGRLMAPLGEYSFDAAYQQYALQGRALAVARPDLIIIETIADLAEMRAALIAMGDHAPGIPRIAQITIDEGGRTFTGTDPETAVVVLQALGADVIGLNCGVGPGAMVEAVRRMARVSRVPISVQANAGVPVLESGGRTRFPMGPVEFAEYAPLLVKAGAALVGGCCGTTPEHIRRVRGAVQGLRPGGAPDAGLRAHTTAFASRTRTVVLEEINLPVVIGERINPTGRKNLAADIRNGQFQLVRDEARRQAAAGATMLDVNVGVPSIDERAAMAKAIQTVQDAVDLPLCIDSPGVEVLGAGLESYIGKALVNSFSGEPGRLEQVLPLAARFGAGVLGLTLDENGIPWQATQRLRVAKRLVDAALAAGIHRSDIVIDVLCLTAGAQQAEANETLKAVRLVKEELGVRTALGISNVSFGLPQRPFLNAVFLSMALAQGLDLAIINPLDERLMDTVAATRVFQNRDLNSRHWVTQMSGKILTHTAADSAAVPPRPAPPPPATAAVKKPENTLLATLYQAVVDGDKDQITEVVAGGLSAGANPMELLNQGLIPGIEEVGRRFGEGIYFLPQLMLSAIAMQRAFGKIKPELQRQKAGQTEIGTIVLATVQGDVHDIGKNICAVLLENYGFRVIDLGRDVKNEVIVEKALAHGADMVGLSALMTTTMPQMPKVIEMFARRGVTMPVLIGGAATSQSYAEKIGAAGYGRDARAAVQLALRVLAGIKSSALPVGHSGTLV